MHMGMGILSRALKFYLAKRNWGAKIHESYTSREQIILGVSKGWVLGPLLFNIFLSNIFIILNEIYNPSDADDNTLYKACDEVDAVVENLSMSAENLFKQFRDHHMKGNTYQLILLSTGDSN